MKRTPLLLLVGISSLSLTGADDAGKTRPVIHLTAPERGKQQAFVVTGIEAKALAELSKVADKWQPEQWAALFAVYVENKDGAKPTERPAMLGSYRVVDDLLRFEPRFELRPGLTYRAAFDPSRLPGAKGGEKVTKTFEIPKRPQSAPTIVQSVYPTTNLLPENQLKFYIHFSAPMSKGQAYDHVRLLDRDGKEIANQPFLELGEELWDPSGKRFTLFFHPGRIKRGLKPREEDGPTLEEGKTYTLLINRKWADAEGNPLKEPFRKTFKVGAPDDRIIDIKTWKTRPPPANGRVDLVLVFPKPLDHAHLERLFRVVGPDEKPVSGKVQVKDEEKCWLFYPDQRWQPGQYYIEVSTVLEDLAGNSIARPFEVDEFRPIQKQIETKTVKIPFEIKSDK